MTPEQHHEIEYLERVQSRYIDNLVRQKAQVRDTRANNGKAQIAANGKAHGANGKSSNAIL